MADTMAFEGCSIKKARIFSNIDDLEIWFEHILSTEKFDRNRVYLTGLSMGGFGTFRWIAKDSSRFSAAASICGGWERNNLQIKPLSNELTNLASIPLWVFHGEKDKIVPFYMGKQIFEILPSPKFSYFNEQDDHMMEYNQDLIDSLKNFINQLS